MESQRELPFESRSNIPLDPRTKIYLLLTVTTFMTAGSGAIVSNYIRPILALFPFLMLLFSHRWKATITFGLTYVVLYILDLVLLPVLKGVWGFLLGGMVGIYTYILPGFVMGFYLIDTSGLVKLLWILYAMTPESDRSRNSEKNVNHYILAAQPFSSFRRLSFGESLRPPSGSTRRARYGGGA